MQLSAGFNSPELRSRLVLAAVALAALAAALLLSFAFARLPRQNANASAVPGTTVTMRFSAPARKSTAQTPVAGPAAKPPAAPAVAPNGPPTLWALLIPFAFAVDAIALLGLAIVLIARYNARRRRGVRT